MHPFSSSHWPIRGPQHPAGLEDEKGCPQGAAFDINGSRLTAPFEAVAAFLHQEAAGDGIGVGHDGLGRAL